MPDRSDEQALSSLCDLGRMGQPLRQEEGLVLAVASTQIY